MGTFKQGVYFSLSLSSACRAPANSQLQPAPCSIPASEKSVGTQSPRQAGRERHIIALGPNPSRASDCLQKLINQLTAHRGGKGLVPGPGVGTELLLHRSRTARPSASFGREGCVMPFNVIYCTNQFSSSILLKKASHCVSHPPVPLSPPLLEVCGEAVLHLISSKPTPLLQLRSRVLSKTDQHSPHRKTGKSHCGYLQPGLFFSM